MWEGKDELATCLIKVTVPEICSKRKSDFLAKSTNALLGHNMGAGKKPEVTSILKRRNSDQNAHSNLVVSSNEYEEDRSDESGQSEVSADEGESLGDGSQLSNSSFDISELRQNLLSKTRDPQQLTSGPDNVLFHYVQFDATQGVLICPPECVLKSQTLDLILHNFRASCHKVHTLFKNTMRFKHMPALDMAKSVMNKSLIAIREHGVLFEGPILGYDGENLSKKSRVRYWVVGRLFYMPHPKEVYVCYQDNIPQNIIELAFKINLNQTN